MKKILYTLLAAFTAFSCSKDLGNYEYNLIDPVLIGSFDEDHYYVMINDNVTINPELTFPENKTQQDYEYRWILKSRNSAKPFVDTVSRERILMYTPTVEAGTYVIELNVVDKESAIMYSNYSFMDVTGSMTGWVFLEDHDGVAEVSMYALNSAGDMVYVPGILNQAGVDMELRQNPRAIAEVSSTSLNSGYGLWVMTDGCTFFLDYNKALAFDSKQKISNYMSAMVPENYTVSNLTRLSTGTQHLVAFPGDGSFMSSNSFDPFYGDFVSSGMFGQYNFYPCAFASIIMPNDYLLFDNNMKMFFSYNTGSGMILPAPYGPKGEALYMQNIDGFMGISIHNDRGRLFEIVHMLSPQIQGTFVTQVNMPQFNKESMITYNQKTTVPYYANPKTNEVYVYAAGKEKLCSFAGGTIQGEVVAIQSVHFKGLDYDKMNNYMVISTKQSDGTGIVYVVEPKEAGFAQRLTIVEQIKTEAPVVSVQYHEK